MRMDTFQQMLTAWSTPKCSVKCSGRWAGRRWLRIYAGRNKTRPKKFHTFLIILDGSHQCRSKLCAKHSTDLIPLRSYDNLWDRTSIIPILQQRTLRLGEVKWPVPPHTAHQQALLDLSPAAWLWSPFAHHTLPASLRDSSLGATGALRCWAC